MIIKFIREENGQGSVEYILLAAGIIMAALVIFSLYTRTTKSASNKIEETVSTVTTSFQNTLETGI